MLCCSHCDDKKKYKCITIAFRFFENLNNLMKKKFFEEQGRTSTRYPTLKVLAEQGLVTSARLCRERTLIFCNRKRTQKPKKNHNCVACEKTVRHAVLPRLRDNNSFALVYFIPNS